MAIMALLPCLHAVDDPLRDQLDQLEKIHSAVFENRTDYRSPDAPPRSEIIRYIVKGEKFAVSCLSIAPDGQSHCAQTFAFNGRLWQNINFSTGVLQIVPVRARTDPHLLPWCPGVEIPPPLLMFSFLTYVDHVPDERMLFSLDALQDRTWVERRLTAAVHKVVPAADGSATMIVLLAGQKGPAPQPNQVEQDIDTELRLIVRPFQEFKGLRLIADIDSGTTGKPASYHSLVVYKAIPFADGSGSIPFPMEVTVPGEVNPVIHSVITRIILNGKVDDGEFDVDPSHATSIVDPVSGNLILHGE
jgi:hypothetical protein